MTKPGDRVLIIEDCRDGSPATGLVGVYEGDFPRGVVVFVSDGAEKFYYDEFISGRTRAGGGPFNREPLVNIIPFWSPDGSRPHPCGEGLYVTVSCSPSPPYWFPTDNPRIRLPDGSIIWGDECWWGDAENAPPTLGEAQADLENYKTVLRGVAQVIIEEQKSE